MGFIGLCFKGSSMFFRNSSYVCSFSIFTDCTLIKSIQYKVFSFDLISADHLPWILLWFQIDPAIKSLRVIDNFSLSLARQVQVNIVCLKLSEFGCLGCLGYSVCVCSILTFQLIDWFLNARIQVWHSFCVMYNFV